MRVVGLLGWSGALCPPIHATAPLSPDSTQGLKPQWGQGGHALLDVGMAQGREAETQPPTRWGWVHASSGKHMRRPAQCPCWPWLTARTDERRHIQRWENLSSWMWSRGWSASTLLIPPPTPALHHHHPSVHDWQVCPARGGKEEEGSTVTAQEMPGRGPGGRGREIHHGQTNRRTTSVACDKPLCQGLTFNRSQ
jgi:hypothetical protein